MPRTPMGGLSSGWWKGARTKGTGNVQLGGLSGTRGVVQVDASDLVKIGKRMVTMSALVGPFVEAMLDSAARARLGALKKVTPYQRRGDPRYPIHLRNSYVITESPGRRTISTVEGRKFNLVTHDTSPHTISPRFRKALWWPGISSGTLKQTLRWPGMTGQNVSLSRGGREFNTPVAIVHHPGTKGQDLVQLSDGVYRMSGNRFRFQVVKGPTVGHHWGVGGAMPRPAGPMATKGASSYTPGGAPVTGDTAFAASVADAIVAGIAGIFMPVGLFLSLIAIPFAELMEWADKEKKD